MIKTFKIYDAPKECPNCKYEVNYFDSYVSQEHKNYCPNCKNRIIYTVPLGHVDYHWECSFPYGYGAMIEIIKDEQNGK